VVQATPIGMTSHPGLPFDPDALRPTMWVADIVYFPRETELLRSARNLGCRTMSGVGMVLEQAAEAFRLFTGAYPDIDRMRAGT
jgi:shikimate dehydrogenase